MNNGTLFGIGVGPGDPDLITLKAAKVLKQVDVVFAAASTKNGYSLAEEIASTHLKEGVRFVRLGFPMTRDRKRLRTAWEENANTVVYTLRKGKDAAFVTIGDPMTYSTFGYLMRTIKEIAPDTPIEIVPGITSYQAGAATCGFVLAEGEESFTVISGALGAQRLKEVVKHSDNVVMLKVYRSYNEIRNTLDDLDLTDNSILISWCGLNGERIIRNLKGSSNTNPPYLSFLLIRKDRPK
ncbi:MAG: precorrin-2 C(20)-methyltransferase [Thermodesulfobacteriota bacterium]|nr:precorrin-2 C(20)-methyltransferase [Thermodesulfobacteriota bacterium]